MRAVEIRKGTDRQRTEMQTTAAAHNGPPHNKRPTGHRRMTWHYQIITCVMYAIAKHSTTRKSNTKMTSHKKEIYLSELAT
jgi:hypothetical protein